METVKFLGAVITVALGALLAVLFDPEKWSQLAAVAHGQVATQFAAGLLLASIALYLATVYAYDRLLMPSRFWTELGPPGQRRIRRGAALARRPPSSAVWVLYQNMQRVWWGLFTPATLSFALALVVLAAVFLRLGGGALAALTLGVVAVLGLMYWFRPVLGSED
jgi:hypothetical protein